MNNNENFDVNEWKKQKNEERKEIYSLINKEVIEIFNNPQRLKQYLDMQARFDMYSVNNAVLVSNQMPQATQLKSRQEWRKQNVFINKDAKTISILEPSNNYVKSDGTTSTNFNVKKMIDVSDTNVNLKNINKVYDNKLILKALFYKSPIDIKASDELPEGKNAFWNKENNILFIRKEGIEFPQGIHEIVKELANANLDFDNLKETREFKCKCISYLVRKKLNLDVSSFEFDNIPISFQDLDVKEAKHELGEIRAGMMTINERIGKFFETMNRNKNREER